MVARTSINPYEAPRAQSLTLVDQAPWRRSGIKSLQLAASALALTAILYVCSALTIWKYSEALGSVPTRSIDRAVGIMGISHAPALACASLAIFYAARMLWQIARAKSVVQPRFAIFALLGGLFGGVLLAFWSGVMLAAGAVMISVH